MNMGIKDYLIRNLVYNYISNTNTNTNTNTNANTQKMKYNHQFVAGQVVEPGQQEPQVSVRIV